MSGAVDETALAESEAASQRRAEALLGRLGQREAEIAQQLESRLARFDNAPAVSNRSQQLLRGDVAGTRAPRGLGPPDLGALHARHARSHLLQCPTHSRRARAG